MKFSCIYVHLTYSIYVFSRENGGEVMNLVYGSSSSFYMDCEVNFVCVTDSPVWGSFNPVLLRRCLRR